MRSAFGAVYARRALVPIRESLVRSARPSAASASSPPTPATSCGRPLTVIRSSVEHLRRNRAESRGRRREALDDIDAEVGHLTALVEDLLLLARSDSGRDRA